MKLGNPKPLFIYPISNISFNGIVFLQIYLLILFTFVCFRFYFGIYEKKVQKLPKIVYVKLFIFSLNNEQFENGFIHLKIMTSSSCRLKLFTKTVFLFCKEFAYLKRKTRKRNYLVKSYLVEQKLIEKINK